ncbi:hypothetical protein Tco_0123254 [Tanacetum coccineum]
MPMDYYRDLIQRWYFERRYDGEGKPENAKKCDVDCARFRKVQGLPCSHVCVMHRCVGMTNCNKWAKAWFSKRTLKGVLGVIQWDTIEAIVMQPCHQNPVPKIDDKDGFELKGQFLKELRNNTFSGLDHEDANEHIEKEVILFYNGLDVQTRQILDSKGAISPKTIADAKVAIQEMVEYSQKWHNGTSRTRSTETSDGLAAIQA